MTPNQPSVVKKTEKPAVRDDKVTLLPSRAEVVDKKKKPAVKKIDLRRGVLRKLSPRHLVIAAAFVLVVAVPTVLSSLYLFFIANDQYHSSASFSVRSIESSQGSDILGMFTQAASGSTASDSYVLLDYIASERMVEALDRNFDLSTVYGRRGGDFFYALGSDLPIEDKLDYWRKMVDINYDHTSGIINLRVKAFDAATAQDIASFIVSESEKLVNALSMKAREEVLRSSQEEVKLAETRLSELRLAVRSFRGTSQEADPIESAKLASQLIASLDQQLVQLQTDLTAAESQMDADSPRIRVIKTRIASLEKQIELERQRFGSGDAKTARLQNDSNMANRIFQYETLETEREFAERAYTSALASLEKARVDANGQQRYLAVFIDPTRSELAQYPTRLLNAALVFLGSLFLWSVLVMGYYNIRDRN